MAESFFIKFIIALILIPRFITGYVVAQTRVDTSYIHEFDKTNNIKSISGLLRTAFKFTHLTNDQMLNKRNIQANSSAFTGVNLNYNWLSLEYDWNIPHTAVDNNYSEARVISFRAFQVGKKFGIEGNYQKYEGLVFPIKNSRGVFDHFNNVNYNNYSINLYYFLNFSRLSYNSAYKYAVRQVKSSGSIILMLSPSYQSFNVEDTSNANFSARDKRFIEIIQKQPKWFTLLSRGGYTYNFVFDGGKWSVNPSLLGGIGAETPLNNSRIFDRSVELVTSYQGRLNGGYNGDKFFVYLNLIFDKTFYHLDDTELNTTNNYYSFNIGYRFGGLKKKVLGVL